MQAEGSRAIGRALTFLRFRSKPIRKPRNSLDERDLIVNPEVPLHFWLPETLDKFQLRSDDEVVRIH